MLSLLLGSAAYADFSSTVCRGALCSVGTLGCSQGSCGRSCATSASNSFLCWWVHSVLPWLQVCPRPAGHHSVPPELLIALSLPLVSLYDIKTPFSMLQLDRCWLLRLTALQTQRCCLWITTVGLTETFFLSRREGSRGIPDRDGQVGGIHIMASFHTKCKAGAARCYLFSTGAAGIEASVRQRWGRGVARGDGFLPQSPAMQQLGGGGEFPSLTLVQKEMFCQKPAPTCKWGCETKPEPSAQSAAAERGAAAALLCGAEQHSALCRAVCCCWGRGEPAL